MPGLGSLAASPPSALASNLPHQVGVAGKPGCAHQLSPNPDVVAPRLVVEQGGEGPNENLNEFVKRRPLAEFIEHLGSSSIEAGLMRIHDRLKEPGLVAEVVLHRRAVALAGGLHHVAHRHRVDTSLGEKALGDCNKRLACRLGRPGHQPRG